VDGDDDGARRAVLVVGKLMTIDRLDCIAPWQCVCRWLGL